VTEHAKPWRKIFPQNPRVKIAYGFPMFIPAAINVINRQKFDASLTATRANIGAAAIVVDDKFSDGNATNRTPLTDARLTHAARLLGALAASIRIRMKLIGRF